MTVPLLRSLGNSSISKNNLRKWIGEELRVLITPSSRSFQKAYLTLASHHCGPGSNPGVDVIGGLSLLLVLSLASRGFLFGRGPNRVMETAWFDAKVQ